MKTLAMAAILQVQLAQAAARIDEEKQRAFQADLIRKMFLAPFPCDAKFDEALENIAQASQEVHEISACVHTKDVTP